jgi:hypothetical protein
VGDAALLAACVSASRGRGARSARGLAFGWQERSPDRARRSPHRLLAVLCWLVGCGRGLQGSASHIPQPALLTRSHHHTQPYRCRRNIHSQLLPRRCSQAQRCLLFHYTSHHTCHFNNHLIPLVPSAATAAEPTTRPSLPWLAPRHRTTTPPHSIPRSTPVSTAI